MRGRRRWRWILAIGIGLAALGVGGLWVAVRLAPAPVDPIPPVVPREIPAAWIAPEEETAGRTAAGAVPGPTPFASSGSLVFFGNGRRFGEERYELAIDDAGARLTSTGVFEFRFLLTTIRATFRQTLTTDPSLRRPTYALSIDAPLGLRRDVQGDVSGGRAAIISKGERREFSVDMERTIVLGTFATYALLPALAERSTLRGEPADYDVLAFGGGPGRDAPTGPLPTVSIRRDGSVQIRANGVEWVVDRYAVESALGGSRLLAAGGEFLALVAESGDESLVVYRNDYFPSGFEFVDAGGPPR